jgi:5,10-methylenetetrahydrofolate reductase
VNTLFNEHFVLNTQHGAPPLSNRFHFAKELGRNADVRLFVFGYFFEVALGILGKISQNALQRINSDCPLIVPDWLLKNFQLISKKKRSSFGISVYNSS